MITKTALAAAAVATAIAAQPVSVANAGGGISFSFGAPIGNNGYVTFGNGGFYDPGYGPGPGPSSYNCQQARQTLKWDFPKVKKIECGGNVYTFKVKQFPGGPWRITKFNKWNGNYWFA